MKISSSIKIFICLVLLLSCASYPNKIRSHWRYFELSIEDKIKVERILIKIKNMDDREYYYDKLYALFEVEESPQENLAEEHREIINRSIKQSEEERKAINNLDEYINREEIKCVDCIWKRYCSVRYDVCFLISTNNYCDISVKIKIRLNGDPETVSKILLLEDAIEKHLGRSGYSVDLIFVDKSDNKDVIDVKVDLGKWANAKNWASGYKSLAHELLHIMGLGDEYNYIETHAENSDMDISSRIHWFLVQLDQIIPPDANNGIMANSNLKPLHRHVCWSVGLGRECIKAREKCFGGNF